MKVLGLDVSTKTGYAVMEDGALVDYGLLKAPVIGDDGYSLIETSQKMASFVSEVVIKHNPDFIVIEQTNPGRFRVQKLLEFIHMAILLDLKNKNQNLKVNYMDTSQWRSAIKLRLSSDQRKHNKKVKNKQAKGKVTAKHLSVQWVNLHFDKKFKVKDNDICDAICLAYAFHLHLSKPSFVNLDDFLEKANLK